MNYLKTFVRIFVQRFSFLTNFDYFSEEETKFFKEKLLRFLVFKNSFLQKDSKFSWLCLKYKTVILFNKVKNTFLRRKRRIFFHCFYMFKNIFTKKYLFYN